MVKVVSTTNKPDVKDTIDPVSLHNTWVIRMEIAMTDKSVLYWLHEVLGCGTVGPRKVKPGNKPQWRWRCSYRDALYVCKIIWPFAHVKLDKVNQI